MRVKASLIMPRIAPHSRVDEKVVTLSRDVCGREVQGRARLGLLHYPFID